MCNLADIGCMLDAGYFLEKAEQCFRLSRVDELNTAVAKELHAMAQDFMAKAIYIDTLRIRPMRHNPRTAVTVRGPIISRPLA